MLKKCNINSARCCPKSTRSGTESLLASENRLKTKRKCIVAQIEELNASNWGISFAFALCWANSVDFAVNEPGVNQKGRWRMHALQLASLAHTIATQAPAHLATRKPVKPDHAHAYWLASRMRHDFWSGCLTEHREAIQKPGTCSREARWNEILPVIQEILISEPLTRCVSLHAMNLEESGIDSDFTAMAQSALSTHIEARHRCLHLIVFGSGLSTFLAVRLNRLRRSMEEFNDAVLGMMRTASGIGTLLFEPEAAAKFQQAFRQSGRPTDVLRRFNNHALQHWLHRICVRDVDQRSANPRLNARLSQSLLACIPTELFDSFGITQSKETIHIRNSENPDSDQLSWESVASSPLELLKPMRSETPDLAQTKRRW